MPTPEQIRIKKMYRQTFGCRYQPKPHPDSKLLGFLNSNFGLFLLSSVFLAIFSWSYHQWTTYLGDAKENEKAHQRVSLEVMNRLRYINKLTTTFEYDDRRVIQHALLGFDSSANVNPSWLRHYSSIFPEYQQRSLESLIWDLERLSTPQRRHKLRLARERITLIEPYFEKLQYWEVDGRGKGPDKKIGMYALKPEDRIHLQTEVLDGLKFLQEPTYSSAD
jgi:hypothetical protein